MSDSLTLGSNGSATGESVESLRAGSPVALDLLAAFLDVTEASAGVALLLVGVVAVPSHVARLAAGVAHLLPLLLGLLALPGDVAAAAAVVARWSGNRKIVTQSR